MQYLIKEEKLVIQHSPGNGAWTYHLKIPNTKDIKGKWGDLKVSGQIDNYPIEARNLAPVKDSDKMLSINQTIRNSINKEPGDTVIVTLYLNHSDKIQDQAQILECFKDASVYSVFHSLPLPEQNKLLESILILPSENQQVERILKVIDLLK